MIKANDKNGQRLASRGSPQGNDFGFKKEIESPAQTVPGGRFARFPDPG